MVSPETAGIAITLLVVMVLLALAISKSNRKHPLHPVFLKSLGDGQQHPSTRTVRP